MNISLIVAHSINRVIGDRGQLPWKLTKDLQWFRQKTINKCVIMGRKTCESLIAPLPNRVNIVITSNPSYITHHGFKLASNLEEALFLARYIDEKLDPELMIIGGGKVYSQVMNRVNTMYITEVNDHFRGDAYFPNFDKDKFKEVSRIKNNENGIDFDFVTYTRK